MNQSFKTPKGTDLPVLNLRGKDYLEVKFRLVWFREERPAWRIQTEFISITDKSALAKATILDEAGNIISTSHKFENMQGFPDFLEKAETGAIGRALALIGYGTQFCADELDEGARIVDSPVQRTGGVKPGVPGPEDGNTTPRPGMLFYSSNAGRSVHEVERLKGRDYLEQEKDRLAGIPGHAAQRDYHTIDEYLKLTDGLTPEPPAEPAPSSDVNPGDFVIPFGRKYKGRKVSEIARHEAESYVAWLEADAEKKGRPLGFDLKMLKKAVETHYGSNDPRNVK